MFLHEIEITGRSTAKDIVAANYRTSDVFRKYGIEYCCGAGWPLSNVCAMKGIDEKQLIEALQLASRHLEQPSLLDYNKWQVEFLSQYILNVHHGYLKKALPPLRRELKLFVKEHASKYPYTVSLESKFEKLYEKLISLLKYEEQVIFPDILQSVVGLHEMPTSESRSYQSRTAPFFSALQPEYRQITDALIEIRLLTFNYTPPGNACTSHRVVLAKLKELDINISQQIYLERDVLFSRVCN
jgi:regulator of cell morphogenesis and NO signaling